MKNPEIKVVLTLTDGYAQRFTEACLEQLRKRKTQMQVPEQKKESA